MSNVPTPLATYLRTHLSCVSPAVAPLLQGPMSLLQFLFEPPSICTGAGGQQGGGGARGALGRGKVLPDVSVHTVKTYREKDEP